MFDTKDYQKKFEQVTEHFQEDIRKIRTGRAHPSQLDGIQVEVYGTSMPLNQVSNITVADAQLLQVTPFDANNIQNITAAIREDQSLGFNPSDDGRVIRVPVPALTEDRRKMIVKIVGEKAEESRVALRNVRQDVLKMVKKLKDDKQLSEDDVKRIEKGIEDDMSTYNGKIDELFRAKEKEILTV